MLVKSWLALRVDANSQIGLGHAMRCLSLATVAAERGYYICFLSRRLDSVIEKRIRAHGFGLHYLPLEQSSPPRAPYAHSHWLATTEEVDARATAAMIGQLEPWYGDPVAVVVDHYALGAPWHEVLRQHIPVLAVDELADRLMAPDWLVDQTVGRVASDYSRLAPASTMLLLGGQYALLRREFIALAEDLREQRLSVSSPVRILVTLGAVDLHNMTSRLIESLQIASVLIEIESTVVVGGGSRHGQLVADAVATCDFPIHIVTDVDNMAELMAQHHLALGAGGTTAWERCVLGLPSLILVLAANQQHVAQRLEDVGAAISLGSANDLDVDKVAHEIVALAGDPARYRSMVESAFAITDGRGCERVLDIIESR